MTTKAKLPYRNHSTYALAGAGLPMKEIEPETASLWEASGAIKVTSTGGENTYYANEFGHEFFSKNYPRHFSPPEDRLVLVVNGRQLWTDHAGTEQEVICPTEAWAEDLAKIALAWIGTGLSTQVTLTRLGFKPVTK